MSTGNVTRRGKSSWRLKFDIPGTDGQRKTIYETIQAVGKKEARAVLAQRLAAVGAGSFVEPNRVSVAEHVQARISQWHAAGDIGNATRERYDVLLKKQIAPHIGAIGLQRLDTISVEEWHSTMRKRGLSARTATHAHKLLSKALGDAVRRRQGPACQGRSSPASPWRSSSRRLRRVCASW